MNLAVDGQPAIIGRTRDEGHPLLSKLGRQRVRQRFADLQRIVRLLQEQVLVCLRERPQLDEMEQLGDGGECMDL